MEEPQLLFLLKQTIENLTQLTGVVRKADIHDRFNDVDHLERTIGLLTFYRNNVAYLDEQ